MTGQWGNIASLRIYGECLWDAKKARISAENRARRGGTARSAEDIAEITGPAIELERAYEKRLMEAYRKEVPEHVRAWAADIPGLGAGALFPRILASLGHPRVAIPHVWGTDAKGRPAAVPTGETYDRTIRQLWQFAGCGDPETNPRQDIIGRSPTRDDKLRGGKRTTVRPLLHTFSSYLVRMHTANEKVGASRFYRAYTDAKAAAAGNRHQRQCQNKARPPFAPNGCGTVLHPEWGAPGSEWRPGHVNMHGHRMVHKELLRQLWIVTGEE